MGRMCPMALCILPGDPFKAEEESNVKKTKLARGVEEEGLVGNFESELLGEIFSHGEKKMMAVYHFRKSS